jgi:predicted secreted Zn-dependent protease
MIPTRMPGHGRFRLPWSVAGLMVWSCGLGTELFAQNVVRWTTNYYAVTGATVREIRRSMNASRPWRNRETVDAATNWRVEWKFAMESSGVGCRITDVNTVTTIATTLPRYVPPTNVPPEVVQYWVKYFGALARHEAIHAEMAKAAGLEIQTSLGAHSGLDCIILRLQADAAANSILNRRRREERDLDVRTQHGATDGARFP